MKTRIFLFVLMLMACSTTAVVAAEQAQPAGDCGAIPWGAPISAVEEISYSHSSGGVKYYNENKAEPCGLFAVQGANVTYGFRKGGLYVVLMEIAQAKDLKQVLGTLMESYGLPDHKKVDGWDEYRWETDDLRVKLKSQFVTDRIKIGMYYKPLALKE
ncbi:hypothetical protein LF599_02405 [Pseudodesulfovibrio thermohalotolerans]|uniref:hypothetical protein n=1 Tax=Pseudodesulfovibrio thermohalotolerans TaxID=2880651 RepID=UPI0022B9EEBB|nr:hypothetical protein [Pseudodesulfovibrio thermohalotolerans]WFS63030.1 hypothetical protein LF599_02405 [Pseudodesulfovibrio thermohalotolerans]